LEGRIKEEEAVKAMANLPVWMVDAIWAGDLDTLEERAGCICCCAEHTFEHCPARLWEGCRGQGALTRADIDEWARHYGMTREEFLAF
jgi:hypothetical protein